MSELLTEIEFRRRFLRCLSKADNTSSAYSYAAVQITTEHAKEVGIYASLPPDSPDDSREHPLIRAILRMKGPHKPLTFSDFLLYGEAWEHFNEQQLKGFPNAPKVIKIIPGTGGRVEKMGGANK